MKGKILLALSVLTLLSCGAFIPAQAENWSLYQHFNYAKPAFVHQHPFAEAHVVIQVSQADPKRWTLVLNNAGNLLNYFGPDKVQVVIVAYGPGLKMLFKGSKMAKRIQSLNAEGVEFDACHNTMMSFKKKLGYLPKLVNSAAVVPGGIVRIMQLEAHGFRYIKP